MSEYISQLFDISVTEARTLQKTYYLEYGTTLAGLMKHHNADPHPFLDYVHDVDLTPLDSVKGLDLTLKALDGRKFVFTNGSQKHAQRITRYLGVGACFEGMYGIEDANFVPKPDKATYNLFCDRFQIDPKTAVFFEDLSINLKPAKELGFQTILIDESNSPPDEWVDYVSPCLSNFLKAHIE